MTRINDDPIQHILNSLIRDFQKNNNIEPFLTFFANQNIDKGPSPINLDLARTIIRIIEKNASEDIGVVWKICLRLAQLPVDKAPSEDVYKFATFIGLWGIGLIAGLNSTYIALAVPVFESILNNPQTQMALIGAREGLKEISLHSSENVKELFEQTKKKLASIDIKDEISSVSIKSKETIHRGKETIDKSKENIKESTKKARKFIRGLRKKGENEESD